MYNIGKALIASADQGNAKDLIKFLGAFGVKNIALESNGIKALSLLTQDEYDLVVVDMNLKFINGLLFIKEIKTSDKIRNVPTILYGSVDIKNDKKELEENGVVQYLKKGITASNFEFVLSSTLSLFRTSGTIENKYTKAKAALIEDRAAEAVEMYSELRGLAKGSTRSSVGLAQAYEQNDEREKADEIMLEVSKSGKADYSTMIFGIRVELKRGNIEESEKILSGFMELEANSYYYLQAVKAFNNHKVFAPVERLCVAAIEHRFKIPDFHITLAKAKYTRQSYDEALKIIDDSDGIFGKTNDSLNLRGVCYRKVGDYENAMVSYEDALKLSPGDARIYFNLAICAIDTTQYKEAKEYLVRCLQVAPNFQRAKDKLDELNEKVA